MYFNPRSRVGNDDEDRADNGRHYIFQSTFPRGERRRVELISKRHSIISIHVPAWGTTDLVLLFFTWFCISIHVPAWGTTVMLPPFPVILIFQSTFPRGERLSQEAKHPRCSVLISIHVPAWGTTAVHHGINANDTISIHVPAWGTTPSRTHFQAPFDYFNPRSRVGND